MTIFTVTGVDWPGILLPDTPLLEIFMRGSLMYWALFLLMRFVIRREVGELGITDLLVVVLLADASQNAMAGGYQSVPDGILLVLIIALWAFVIDWLSYRSHGFERFSRPRTRLLVDRGRLVRSNVARELISDDELFGLLRERGVENLGDVKSMRVESDGKISVVTFSGQSTPAPERRIR